MKRIYLAVILLVFVTLSCKKKTSVSGRVLENNTLKPIEKIPVKFFHRSLFETAIDSTLTNQNGEYFFDDVEGSNTELAVKISPKHFYTGVGGEEAHWSVFANQPAIILNEENTINFILNPIGAIKVNFKNFNPVNDDDWLNYSINGEIEGNDFNLKGQLKGAFVDTTIKYIPSFEANKNLKILYSTRKNGILSDTFNKVIFCKGRDTAFLEIKY